MERPSLSTDYRHIIDRLSMASLRQGLPKPKHRQIASYFDVGIMILF